MKYENEKLGCSFSLPDKLTVRQQLLFWQLQQDHNGEPNTVCNWEASKTLITDWVCETLPDLKASLDDMTDPKQARIVTWVGTEVTKFVLSLDEVSPN